jgi:hypothetical protein
VITKTLLFAKGTLRKGVAAADGLFRAQVGGTLTRRNLGRLKIAGPGVFSEPEMQLAFEGEHRATSPFPEPMHRQSKGSLPTLHRTHAAIQL